MIEWLPCKEHVYGILVNVLVQLLVMMVKLLSSTNDNIQQEN